MRLTHLFFLMVTLVSHPLLAAGPGPGGGGGTGGHHGGEGPEHIVAPEPGTWLLMGIGVTAVLGGARYKRKSF
jgi:hypothetical protein